MVVSVLPSLADECRAEVGVEWRWVCIYVVDNGDRRDSEEASRRWRGEEKKECDAERGLLYAVRQKDKNVAWRVDKASK